MLPADEPVRLMCGAGRAGNVMLTPPTVVLPVRSTFARAVPVCVRPVAFRALSCAVVELEMLLVLTVTSALRNTVLGDAKLRPRKPARPSKPFLSRSALSTRLLVDVAVNAPRTSRYHVIGGCFSMKDNADRFLTDLQGKGFQASLIDQHRGLYRVAYGSYPNKATALEAMEAVRRDQGTDVWLLVK